MWIDDLIFKNCEQPLVAAIWVPDGVWVVGGNSNDLQRECHIEQCIQDGVSLLKRCGGGGTVVLHPGCVVVSVGLWVKSFYRNDFYFKQLNASLINVLKEIDPKFADVYQDGISDLVFAGKKIAGTSLFRSRNYLLYQASILVDAKIDLIDKYLAHPSKEPSYRQGKPHDKFLSCLSEHATGLESGAVKTAYQISFLEHVKCLLEDEMIPPQEEQILYLKKKVSTDERASGEQIVGGSEIS